MNTPIETSNEDALPKIDSRRRRLTQGGLAAPVIIGTLLSRPVLGATHNCTISGQQSGNVSTHTQGLCSVLGNSPSGWGLKGTSIWPTAFKDNLGNPLLFKDTPNSLPVKFADAFLGASGDATVMEVLNGTATVKPGSSATVALGREAVAAAMNALDGTNGFPAFPIGAADVVQMLNNIHSTGLYTTADFGGVSWTEAQVIDYLNNLHP